MSQPAQVGHALAPDLAAVLPDDEGGRDRVAAGLVESCEVRLAARGAGAADGLDVGHAHALQRDEHELDERVPRELLELAEHRAARGLAVAVDRGDDLLLEARKLAAE
jgi:hypothetical protein